MIRLRMDAVFADEPFEDFGDDPFLPFPRTSVSRIAAKKVDQLRRLVRETVPKVPGVYGMLDLRGRLIYVGKSKSLRGRLLSYFLPHNEDEKSGRIVQSAATIVWETQPSEFASLLREQYLIRTWQPRFNVQGVPKRQKPVYLCLGKPPAECLYVSRFQDATALVCQGPLFGSGRLRRCVEILNRTFRLRDCSNEQKFSYAEQLRLFDIDKRPGCLRYELGTCLGPCVQGSTRKAYEAQVEQARLFMLGENDQPIADLEQLMVQAAQRCHFEQATVLRDDLKHVQWLVRRLTNFAEARKRYSFVYPVKGHDGRDCWYIIRHGEVVHCVPSPCNQESWKRTKHLLKRWLQSPAEIGETVVSRPETVSLVSGWFRANRQELKSTFDVDKMPSWSRTTLARKSKKAESESADTTLIFESTPLPQ